MFLGAKAPLELVHVIYIYIVSPKSFRIAITCSLVFLGVFWVFLDVFGCFLVFLVFWGVLGVFLDVFRSFGGFLNVLGYFWIFLDVLGVFLVILMFFGVFEWFWVFLGAFGCLGVF